MERTIPTTTSEDIELYMRTYYSLLRSSSEIQIKALIETHTQMDSSLHANAKSERPDISAFVYSTLRLPDCIKQVRLVVLGQSDDVFEKGGFNVEHWQEVSAPGRRRKLFYDGNETLAAFIASVSDIDDIIPILTAFEIEWNKMNDLLTQASLTSKIEKWIEGGTPLAHDERKELAQALLIHDPDLTTLENIWGKQWLAKLLTIATTRKRFALRLLAGSLIDYRRATRRWWRNIAQCGTELLEGRPVYFVSSNMHALANLISGYAGAHEKQIIEYIQKPRHADLLREYQAIQSEEVKSRKENFLYYAMKKYCVDSENLSALEDKNRAEEEAGLTYFRSERYLDVDVQVIELNRLTPERLDPRLPRERLERLRDSHAVIFNIDYPLGVAAYQILSEVARNIDKVVGLYVLGKAASLNARIGDVLIPNVVYDEHSRNTYLFTNCFSSRDVTPHIVYGSVLDNQKSISVQGTFLQNRQFIDVFYREGYTDIEMEAGPYLSAMYEMSYPKRYPSNEIVRLYNVDFDIGFLHYVSDTPYSKGQNLGAVHSSYYGMDATYATALAILQRILERETK